MTSWSDVDWAGTLVPLACVGAAGWLVGGWRWAAAAVLLNLAFRSETNL